MATVAHSTSAHHAAHDDRLDRGVLGMALFIASEVALFASFFAAYFYLRGTSVEWNPADYEIPRFLTGINTAILVSSSFTVWIAERMIKSERRGAYVLWMAITIALGTTFLAIQLYEYHHLEFRPSDGAIASTFFSLTGLHGMHVTVGAILLAVGLVRGARGLYGPHNHASLTAFSIYWHFVDVVWVFLYGTVYLWQPS